MIRKLSEKCAVPKKEFSFENRGKRDLERNEREHSGHKVSLKTIKVSNLLNKEAEMKEKSKKKNERRKKK